MATATKSADAPGAKPAEVNPSPSAQKITTDSKTGKPKKGKTAMGLSMATGKKLQRSLNKVRFIAAMKAVSGAATNQFEPRDMRRFLFDEKALKKPGTSRVQTVENNQKPEEDFNDIVDQDDQRIGVFISQVLVGHVIESFIFKGFIFLLIIVNAILIGLQTDPQLAEDYKLAFNIFDQAVLAIFTLEILLKWYYGFWIFWKVGWNILDFGIVIALLIGPQLTFLSSGRILRVLRVLRAFRSLRSVSALAGLSTVVQTILHSIPDMTNICLLLCIIVLAFGVVGVFIFGDILPNSFGDLPTAMFSLFICVTQDGWVTIYNNLRDEGGTYLALGAIYFFISILIGAFVFANLVVAVVVTNLEMAIKELKAEREAEGDIFEDDVPPDIPFPEDSTTGKCPITTLKHIRLHHHPDFADQIPMEKVMAFQKLNMQNLEKYFIILAALEENLAEYLDIKNDILQMFNVVKNLNEVDIPVEEEPQEEVIDVGLREGVSKTGDILSNLMELEEKGKLKVNDKNSMAQYLKSVHSSGSNLGF